MGWILAPAEVEIAENIPPQFTLYEKILREDG